MRRGKVRAEQVNLIGLGISSHLAALVAKETRILSGKKLNSIIGKSNLIHLVDAL
jgi:hypothetical protein